MEIKDRVVSGYSFSDFRHFDEVMNNILCIVAYTHTKSNSEYARHSKTIFGVVTVQQKVLPQIVPIILICGVLCVFFMGVPPAESRKLAARKNFLPKSYRITLIPEISQHILPVVQGKSIYSPYISISLKLEDFRGLDAFETKFCATITQYFPSTITRHCWRLCINGAVIHRYTLNMRIW